jgi:hypothetical protein
MLCFDESFFVFSSNEVTKFGTIFGADHYNVFFKEKSSGIWYYKIQPFDCFSDK